MQVMDAITTTTSTGSLPRLDTLSKETMPQALDGSEGCNREQQRTCQIRAHNDYEAIHCWLNEYRHNPRTYRLYLKEAERLLLWSLYQQRKPFSSLDTDDLKAYFEFLDNPQPAALWCGRVGGRKGSRYSEHWRPFVGPVSASSKATAITVIHSLISYLVDAHYLAFDPLKLIRKKVKSQQDPTLRQFQVKQRMLEMDEWQALLTTLQQMPEATQHEKDEKSRLTLIVHMLYFLGLRISELVNHQWRAFREEEGRWWFYVVGKGNKLGKIPVNSQLLATIRYFRLHYLNCNVDPSPDDERPIIPSWRSGQGLSARQVNVLLKRLAEKTSRQFITQPDKMAKLKRFSAHWLRHFSASMQDRVGIPFSHIRENHRHQNDETTRLYVHAGDAERHAAMEQFTLVEQLKINEF